MEDHGASAELTLEIRPMTYHERARMLSYGIRSIDCEFVVSRVPSWPAYERQGCYSLKYVPRHFQIDGRRYLLFAFVWKSKAQLLLVRSGWVTGYDGFQSDRILFEGDCFSEYWERWKQYGNRVVTVSAKVIAESGWIPKKEAGAAMATVFADVPKLAAAALAMEIL